MWSRKLAAPLVILVVAFASPPAHATVFSGACAVSVNFSFNSPVTATPKSIGYSVALGPARTVTQVTRGCVTDVSPLSPFRSTSGSGSGHAVTWTCEAAVGLGTWEQSWDPDPPPMSGAHSIAGTWGDWTMVVNSSALNFVGEMELTVDPADAAKLAQCATSGISSLSMIGIMHFQDPSL
jgi:hypothetical protein